MPGNAKKAGVTERVKFIEGDLFQADFHEATVLPMYLLTTVNLSCRPKILRELEPGSRVVSHNFAMDNWKPDAHTELKVEDVTHDVFLWIVPANVSGTWTWTAGPGAGAAGPGIQDGRDPKIPVPRGRGQDRRRGGSGHEPEAPRRQDQLHRRNPARRADRSSCRSRARPSTTPSRGPSRAASTAATCRLPWKASRNPASIKPIDDEPAWWN